jgi:hypothetical protein
VSPLGRVVATGSGLVALLNSFRTSHVNGFALWDAVSFLSVGREPSLAAAQSMAARILPPYSTDWPSAAKAAITPTALIDALRSTAQGHFTSLRPALLAYTLGCMGDARTGPPEEVIAAALGSAMGKVRDESTRDTLTALVALDADQRRVLREVATGSYTVAELEAIRKGMSRMRFKNANVGVVPEKLAALITCLREEGTGSDVVRLQPPYSILLESWLRSNGELAVAVHGDKIRLDDITFRNLVFIAQTRQRRAVGSALRRKVGIALFDSLAGRRVGVWGADGSKRPPHTAAEFSAIPALHALNVMLSASFLDGYDEREPALSLALKRAAPATAAAAGGVVTSASAKRFREEIGWELLLAFRHFQSHVWDDPVSLVSGGLTAPVIADAVSAAALVLAEPVHGCFDIVDSNLQLRLTSS